MHYIALQNLRSLHNIGAIFRTCSFFGFYNVLLVGYSGRNYDFSGKSILHPEIAKTALGAQDDIKITFLDSADELISFAQERQLEIAAVEQTETSINIKNFSVQNDSIFVFGNEVDGVSKELLSVADKVLQIERSGKHNSLNVTTACGILLYHLQSNV